MRLQRHHIIAAMLALSLSLIVFAFPGEGQLVVPDGDMNDSGNSDIISACEEEWTCAEWSGCIDGYKIRECIDQNQCGTTEVKPSQMMECDYTVPPIETCTEDWVCSKWSDCTEGHQKRICEDINQCGTNEFKPELKMPCEITCIENWSCEPWSGCFESKQVRICTDLNTCTAAGPVSEVKTCTIPAPEDDIEVPQNDSTSDTATNETGKNITRTYEEIIPEASTTIIIDESDVSIKQMDISVNNMVEDVTIELRKLESKPEEVPEVMPASSGEVFEYLEISKDNMTDDDIDSVTINFEVSKEWLREQGINVSTIRLIRLESNAWTELPTILISADTDNFYFRAETPGFSIFAIAGEYMLEKSGRDMMCLPLDTRCYGKEVQECGLDGLAWTIVEECEYGCRSPGVCNEASEDTPAQGGSFVLILLLAILAVIVVLGIIVTLLRMKGKRASQEIEGVVTPPRTRR